MGAGLAQLNAALEADLGLRLKIGIGIHCGPAIIGEMGHGGAMNLTAIGDAVNTASRLESATKEFGAELVVSEEVALRGGLLDGAHPGWTRATVTLRGKSEPLRSEEHTSELQSLMRNSYAVFCLKKKK